MDFNTAKKAIDFLWEHSSDSSSLDIGFYGGEPLIAIDLIKKVIDYSEKLFVGKEIGFTITTNATLLSEDIIHYFILELDQSRLESKKNKENEDKE